ncbi:aspartate aminotransferase family protein [Haliscomenobacter sp.]|uniref:pyridoxal phosphate-dependent decarboxylase family protein n=1 Tax=Haliscomenobacter sp. TaxID=2717303 RepID=UPI003593112A
MANPTKVGKIQDAMFQEIQDRQIFKSAQTYAFQYLNEAFDRNVYPSPEALNNLQHFEESMPDKSGDVNNILQQLHQYGSPATVTSLGGRYFGFVTGSSIPASLAAKSLSDFWDQNTGMEVLSPVSAKLETVVEGWLNELLGLPQYTVAGFVSGSSMAIYCGLAAARWRLFQKNGWDVNEQGMNGAPKVRVVTGKHTHSTVLKAIQLLGFGKANIEWAEVDEQGRIISETMPSLDSNTLVILQAGNVNSGSFDPIESICQKAYEAGAWVHIDGAFGLWAAAATRFKHLTKGMELAQSWSADGHKTLNTPYDCGIILCQDQEALVSALHMSGAYIVEGKRDGMYYTPEMSRRARVIELWATLKYLGKSGVDELVTNLHERAVQFAQDLGDQGFEVLNEVVFNQVLIACGEDEMTEKVLKNLQELRVCWCGGSMWHGRKVIRISVCSWATTVADVEFCVASFVKARALATSPELIEM